VSITEHGVRLRLLTYNIHRAIGVDRRFRPERIVEILVHHDADIALLQEVDEGVPRSGELDLARELAEAADYPHYAVGHNVALDKGRYGNAVLSRHAIVRERNIDLTVDARKRRGCQHTSIQVDKPGATPREIELFNLHLGLSAQERARQIGALYRSPEFAALDGERPCFVGGDFNDWRSLLHPIFTEILGFRCATQMTHGYNRVIRTYPAFSPTGGLDKIYFRGGIRLLGARACRMRVARVASDHRPIIADFELT